MSPKKKKSAKATKPSKLVKRKVETATLRVDAIKHNDTRVNIPTNELRKFVRKAEEQYPVSLYPRNPELDPQLVWKGKDQQDSEPLAVPAVPIYIQEKIRPQSIIENLKRQTKEHRTDVNLELFADFNGIESFEDKIDFYHHEGHWTNRMILGDSLLVMNSLAEKEGMKGKVQSIFMDPPYGINFTSNWQTKTSDKQGSDTNVKGVSIEPEQIRAFRDTWKFGLSSYLGYLRDRLQIAHELLTQSGSIFVQIGDENCHLIRSILDEVFGPKNFVSQIVFRKKLMPLGSKMLETMCDHIIWYAKDKESASLSFKQLYKPVLPDPSSRWTGVEEKNGNRRMMTSEERENPDKISDENRVFRVVSQTAPSYSEQGVYEFKFEGKSYVPPRGASWVTTKDKMDKLAAAGRLVVEKSLPGYVMYHDDFGFSKLTNPWTDTAPAQDKHYVVETNPEVIERCILMTSNPGDIVLDPTCGSGTTAYVAEKWGRRWITIDTSRVALALARTRIMAARYPYFLLADSPEGARKEMDLSGTRPSDLASGFDVKRGFVYRRVPHITLKSIANNSDIKVGMSRAEINAAIQRHAEPEYLYDQPYEDPKRVRVSGPFTVESLSPHRLLDPREAGEPKDADSSLVAEVEAADFRSQILENLRKAGIQNTKKHERLVFDALDPHSGAWVHAKGRYTDADGNPKFVAISIGPKYGTITPQYVQEASKEAMKGTGHQLLVILGFAFGGYVPDEVKQFGELTILIVRMNPDLMMGDELLKKTGAGNLFTVFGEPDIEFVLKEGQVRVNIKGVDIYDPTTGEVRSSKPEEIACWFIDTDYNDESFFVRHAYFLGEDEPYEKLKRALQAEIDEEAWSQLHSAKSRPFEKPTTGRFAVKVINHYGDEVMKVFEIK